MEIGIEAPYKYENIISNAYWTRAHIDSMLRVSIDDIEDYKKHLLDCEKQPTVGALVKRKYITKEPMNYPLHAKSNMLVMNLHPQIIKLKEELLEKINTLYPKTKHIRQYIIDNDRVVLDSIKPVKKYSKLNKLAIALRRFI